MANTSDVWYGPASDRVGHFFENHFATISGWQIAVAVLVALIAYDQCMPSYPRKTRSSALLTSRSHVHQEQRIYCWTDVQTAIHGTVPSIT